MLVHATPTQADAIVRAMKCVATGDGTVALSAVDVVAIEACHHIVLHRPAPLDVASLRPITPAEVAGLVGGGEIGEHTVQFLAVVALVDGSVRRERIDVVARYSAALGLREDYLDELIAAGEGRLQWALADMSRRNVVSISDGRLRPDDFALWPYREAPDATLAARYRGWAGWSQARSAKVNSTAGTDPRLRVPGPSRRRQRGLHLPARLDASAERLLDEPPR